LVKFDEQIGQSVVDVLHVHRTEIGLKIAGESCHLTQQLFEVDIRDILDEQLNFRLLGWDFQIFRLHLMKLGRRGSGTKFQFDVEKAGNDALRLNRRAQSAIDHRFENQFVGNVDYIIAFLLQD